MIKLKVVAIPTEVAQEVRKTLAAPKYGFPVHSEMSTDEAPCRHCLRLTRAGKERRILFTYDRFAGIEDLPQPGPVYIHEEDCTRYAPDGGMPEELKSSPRTLEAYAKGRKLLGQEIVDDGTFEEAAQRLFSQTGADYIQVNSTTAGCFTFRIERAA